MANLEVNLDPFISLENIVTSPLTNPLHLLTHIESLGVGGITFTYREEINSATDLKALRSLTNCRINIRVAPDAALLQNILFLKPDVITIINPANSHLSLDLPSKRVREVVEILTGTKDVSLCLRLEPDVKQLKEAYQLGIDEVEIAVNQLAFKQNFLEYQSLLNDITKAVRVATKNNLRVSLGGNLDARTIPSVAELTDLEFVSVGRHLLAQTLINGFQTSLQKVSDLIK